jgi:DNA-binding response OmpR family regulator
MPQRRILVIEDELLIRMCLVDELGRAGYAIEEAETGRAGLARLAEGGIDLVLLDYHLPDTDGLRVLAEIAARHAEVAVVFMSAHASSETTARARLLGARDFIAKPFDMDDVSSRLDRALAPAA